MRKLFPGKTLSPIDARRAFSLSELIVAVGILLLMLALAGQVMSLTVKSTGQARALTKVSQLLRSFEQTLREDLRRVDRQNSVVFIQGNPIKAYWKQADKDVGRLCLDDPERQHPTIVGRCEKPRADILMIFTSGTSSSFVDPTVKSELQQVVYGHADLGKFVPAGGSQPTYEFEPSADAFPDQPTDQSNVPAETWHLARRSVLLMPTPSPPPATGTAYPWSNEPPETTAHLAKPEILQGQVDIVANFDFARDVLNLTLNATPDRERPGRIGGEPYYLPPIFDPKPPSRLASRPFERSQVDPAPPPTLARQLGHYFLPGCASFKVEWALDRHDSLVGGRLDGEKDLYWFDQGVDENIYLPTRAPDPLILLRKAMDEAEDDVPRWQRLDALLNSTLVRDSSPVCSLRTRFGAGDPDWIITDYGSHDRANTVVMGAARRKDVDGDHYGDVVVPDEVFPGALRITVDVFDDARRLERPVRHVMVIPIGEQ